MNGRFGEPILGPVIPFGAMVEYYPISARDQSRLQPARRGMDEAGDNSGLAFGKGGYSWSTLMDICHLKNAKLEPQFQKCKGRDELRGDIVKDDSGSYAVFYWTRFISFANDCCKSNCCHCKTTRLWRTSSRRDIWFHSGKNGSTLQNCSEFQSQNVQIYGYAFHDTNGPNQGQTLKIQWFLRERHLYGHPLAGLFWWKTVRGSSAEAWMGKRTELGNVYLFIENKD